MYEGMKVNHVRYGSGSLLAIEEGRARVSFESLGEKAFPYPDSFEKFIRFEDGTAQAEVLAEIRSRKVASLQAERERTIQFHEADLQRRRERAEKAEKARRTRKTGLPVSMEA